VFQNLIDNAIEYRGPEPLKVDITIEVLEGNWLVKVIDNGIGIAREQQQGIFDLFGRPHGHKAEGGKMGLAVCKKLIEGMGGKIWVDSETGKGSTFSFTVAPADEEIGFRGRETTHLDWAGLQHKI
jgi:signal transduction histidine kinase